MGILFLNKVKSLQDFNNGIFGQILFITNIGNENMYLENNSSGDFQKMNLVTDRLLLKKNQSLTLVFDGYEWRILKN